MYEELVSRKANQVFVATREMQRHKLDTVINKSRSITERKKNATRVEDAAKDCWVVNLSDRKVFRS